MSAISSCCSIDLVRKFRGNLADLTADGIDCETRCS